MLEQKIDELTAAVKANTAALLGGATKAEKPAKAEKSEKAEKPAKADKEEKPAKKESKAPSIEKLRTTFEVFLGVSDEDERAIRRKMVKKYAEENDVAKITELPESAYADAIEWVAEATEAREEAIKKAAKKSKKDDEDEEDGI